jgi:hypothetical protein
MVTLAKKIFVFLIPVPQTCLILLVSCPVRGASRGVRKRDRARAGRRGNPKVDAAPGDVLASTNREALGFRPALRKGSATVSWLDGDRRAAPNRRAQGPLRGPAKSPEERTRVLRRRGGTLRGVAVCLCFPSVRETCRGRYQRCAFRRSVSPQGGGDQLKAQLARRREDESAWLFEM